MNHAIDPRGEPPVFPVVALLLTLLVCLFLSGNAEAEETNITRPHFDEAHIENSPGGVVKDFLRIRDDFIADGTAVHISGYCASACTLFLSVPDVCVYEDTRLGFHAPFLAISGIPLRIYNDQTTAKFLQYYPEPIRKWIEANGGLQPDLIWLEGEEMLELVPLCEGEPVT